MRVFAILLLAACAGSRSPPPAAPAVAEPAVAELEQQCTQGHALACYDAAAVHQVNGKHPQRAQALRERGNQLTLDACRAADPDLTACRRIVVSAKLAATTTTDAGERKALAMAIVAAGTRACHAGDLDVCIDVAAILATGQEGAARDPGRAREIVSFACTRDHQPACVELALTYAHDRADPRSRERAEDLLAGACSKQSAQGCELLATLRLSGGTDAAAGAREAAHKGCQLGGAGACAVYGHTLLDGIGGPADAAAARVAFEAACRGNDERGCQMLNR